MQVKPRTLLHRSRVAAERAHRQLTPAQLFVGSFLLLIALGTLGLGSLPWMYAEPGGRLSWVDALFTATSAVCVTGLVVVDTATYFSAWGQAFLLVLVQLGGLGMITFTTLIILALGRRLSLRHERIVTSTAEVAPGVRFEALARDVVIFTFGIEMIGAVVLYAFWVPRFGWSGALWPAIFHAISAFCNAGFALFSDSLVGQRDAPGVLLVIMALIVIGGLGFLTLEELRIWGSSRRAGRRFRLSLHSRLALWTTGGLLLVGWFSFLLFEWQFAFHDLTVADRVVNALFASVTARTAGFNTFSYDVATDSTAFLTIILMFIGGSPGSMAGGMKTTTLALLVMLAWSRYQGREVAAAGNRSVPEETVQRAVGLAVTAFALVTLSIFVLTWTERTAGASHPERHSFLAYMFEAVSAFNTVGLSMGATPDLSTGGRVLASILMFVGRVGPLTFAAALALAARRRKVSYRYAYEDVIVG